MAFVVEKIPQEELSSPNQKLIGFNPALSSRWAIDRERDAFIVLNRTLGGAYDGTQVTDFYTLCWKGELIRIVADPLPKTYTERGAIMSWRVHGMSLPESLLDRKEYILQLVKDAFTAIGEAFNGQRFIGVNVEFEPTSSHRSWSRP